MAEITNETVASIEMTLSSVARALERLRAGTYRQCQVCGRAIDDADLIADALLSHCSEHPELA